MTIDQAKKVFDYIGDIYQNGKLSGSEFTNLFNQEQNLYYSFLLGNPEQFQPGRPVPRVGIGMSESVRTRLSPFIKYNGSIAVASQVANKPSDFGRAAIMLTNDGKGIEIIDHAQKSHRINSSVITSPFAVEYSASWKIWPNTISSISLDYYPNKPDDVLWNYTVTGGRDVYNATGSLHPLWLDSDVYKIIGRMLRVAGVNMDDAQLINYGLQVINTGE